MTSQRVAAKRTIIVAVNSQLAFGSNGGSGHKRESQHAAHIADEIPRGHVVAGIHNNTVLLGYLKGIARQEAFLVRCYLQESLLSVVNIAYQMSCQVCSIRSDT